MSLVLALLLFSAPDAQWRHPAEDDANVAARMAVAEAVFPDATVSAASSAPTATRGSAASGRGRACGSSARETGSPARAP
jgi:hypothetical protein